MLPSLNVGTTNISQSLFLMDEEITRNAEGQQRYEEEMNTSMISDWNSIKRPQMSNAAFINQSRLSTWYQDNGSIPILGFSTQFGLPMMGGPYNTGAMNGSRPGYKPSDPELLKFDQMAVTDVTPLHVPITTQNGIMTPSFMTLKTTQYN